MKITPHMTILLDLLTKTPVLISCVYLLTCQLAFAQLNVLSKGDVDAKWKETQIGVLKQQLADPAIRGPLRDELESQLKWMNNWPLTGLTEETLWKPDSLPTRISEPTLDPNRRASALREKLFGPNAMPTVADTKALEKLLSQFPNDVGVRQLHLHWLDQKQYRKIYPDEIADAALRIIGILDQLQPQDENLKLAKAFCLYRRGRALAYRELPDVVEKKPIPDPKQHESELLGSYKQLINLVGSGHPEFILLEVRMLRRDNWNGRALELLENYGPIIEKQWFLKKRRDLLRDLGWTKPAEQAAEIYAENFPEAVAAEKQADENL